MKSSYKRLTLEQRHQIKRMRDQNCSLRTIASAIGVSNSTVHYELRVNISEAGQYDPDLAHKRYLLNMHSNRKKPAILSNPELAQYIANMILNEHQSPEQISQLLRKEPLFNQQPATNTIYRAIDQGLIPGVTRESLRSHETKMFSSGMICIPKWARDQFEYNDGDTFSLSFSETGTITLIKKSPSE